MYFFGILWMVDLGWAWLVGFSAGFGWAQGRDSCHQRPSASAEGRWQESLGHTPLVIQQADLDSSSGGFGHQGKS